MQVLAEIQYVRGNQIGVGQGMNSTVFLADDLQLGGQFAVKEIEKRRFGNDVSRYFEEATAMFATAHPSIVPIQYACQTTTHVVLAMPFFANGSLAPRICDGPVTIKELIRIAQGVLHGVARIHQKGFIHFDIKPSNILFDRVDEPLVADFGQTRRLLANGVVQAPLMYARAIPPEIWTSGIGSALSDIYQVGLLLYRAVNGDPLYRVQHAGLDDATLRRNILTGRFPNRKMFLPHVPQRVRTIIRKALNVDPLRRYASAEEFSAAIGRIPAHPEWCTVPNAQGEFLWRAARPGRASLEVELIQDNNGWSTRVWTLQASIRRARNRVDYWRSNLTYENAIEHLEQVFGCLD